MTQFRFIYLVFLLTAALVFAVHVRSTSSRAFYKFRIAHLKQTRLNQNLRQEQLLMESLVNPAAISERLEQINSSKR